MIWAKTDAGRAALISGVVIIDRMHRTALLSVDGRTAQAALVASLTTSVQGISVAAFQRLFERGLIAPVAVLAARQPVPRRVERRGIHRLSSSPSLSYSELSAELTRFISHELGIRGLTLMLALERAATVADLQRVRQIAITRARRKGQSRVAAASPRLALHAQAGSA